MQFLVFMLFLGSVLFSRAQAQNVNFAVDGGVNTSNENLTLQANYDSHRKSEPTSTGFNAKFYVGPSTGINFQKVWGGKRAGIELQAGLDENPYMHYWLFNLPGVGGRLMITPQIMVKGDLGYAHFRPLPELPFSPNLSSIDHFYFYVRNAHGELIYSAPNFQLKFEVAQLAGTDQLLQETQALSNGGVTTLTEQYVIESTEAGVEGFVRLKSKTKNQASPFGLVFFGKWQRMTVWQVEEYLGKYSNGYIEHYIQKTPNEFDKFYFGAGVRFELKRAAK